MTETYVVTGGAGFIGSHIAERLLNDGHRVRVVDNLITGSRRNLDDLRGDLEFYEVSITDADALPPIFAGADYVFHQAALPSVPRSIDDPLTTHNTGATGTLNVLIAARDAGVKRVVYAASSSAYGNAVEEIKTEDLSPRPLSPYAVSKLAGEFYCQSFYQVYGLETVCLRYFNVFGPRQDPLSQYAAVIPLFITAMLDGQAPTIYGDGQQSRDFTYIDNVVHGNLLAVRAPDAAGEMLNLATGGRITLLDLMDKLNAQLGTDLQPIHAAPRPGDVKHSRAGIDKAQRLLGFAPIVDFDDGLARTIAWYQGIA
ncbi:MAG: SDR family oxidoreductase [Anaerolineaceae bacterium]|nr:SDR family oxidoreductase [Anaerolineaceae bacterium]